MDNPAKYIRIRCPPNLFFMYSGSVQTCAQNRIGQRSQFNLAEIQSQLVADMDSVYNYLIVPTLLAM